MKRKLNINRILVFNDFPDLFLASDNSKSDYLCLLTKYTNESYQYNCVEISKSRLYKFISGNYDLREIFIEPELSEFWITNNTSEKEFEISLSEKEKIDEELLPEADFYFTEELKDDLIRKEVIEHNSVIIHLQISDEKNRKSIPLEVLSETTKLYQSFFENVFKKIIKNSNMSNKRKYLVPENYKFEAFAASPGSFNLHLKSISNINMFGYSIVEKGLECIDKIISNTIKDEELIESLRTIKGHAISNYKKLLDKIIDKNITFKYRWLSPSSEMIHTRSINHQYASKVKNILSLKEDLEEVTKEFIGYVKQADVEKGNWRITNEEDDKDYTGESKGHILDGITLKTIKYKFICNEIIESMKVTEKENIKYILKSFEKIE